MSIDIAIVGGGVSGLATAWELQNQGYSTVVLERQVRTGGNIYSDNISGFMMEHGPSTINAYDAHAQEVSTRLGLASDQVYLGDGIQRRYLVGGGKLKSMSIKPLGFLTSNYLSMGGRLRMMLEPFARASRETGDESVMTYATRRFGHEFAERIIDPLVGGLYAGRARDLSMRSVFPQMLDLERKYGSVAMGMIRRSMAGGHMPGKRLYSWRAGIGTLPRALAAQQGKVLTGVTVRSLRRDKEGYLLDCGQGEIIKARAVVLATQPHVTAGLIEGLDRDSAEAAGSVSTPPLAVVYLGYQRSQVDHPLDGLGFLAAESEGAGLTGVQFSSTMFPGRAPEGCVSLTAYIGGQRQPELAQLPEAELIDFTRQRLGSLLGIHGDPVLSRVRHWNLGLPQYQIGHADLIDKLDGTAQRNPGLFLTGNYFKGPSVAACLGKADETALAVSDYMQEADQTGRVRVFQGSSSVHAFKSRIREQSS